MPIVGMSGHGDDPCLDRRTVSTTAVTTLIHNAFAALKSSPEGCRRRWTDEDKARIVAESFAPGAVGGGVARRHDARAQQVHGWRRDAREGRLVLLTEQRPNELVGFAPVVMAPDQHPTMKPAARPARASKPPAPMIEIDAKDVVVRAREGADVALVEAMLRALRARA
jgi:transposase